MTERTQRVSLADIIQKDVPLPVCPAVFMRLTEALAQMDDTNLNIAEIISADPALTSQVLRVVNSAYYAVRRQVRSVNEAVLRLGYREIWAIASALKVKQLFQGTRGEWSPLSAGFYLHALRCAVICRELARPLQVRSPDEVFTAALLHDLGKTVLHRLESQYILLCQNGALWGRDLVQREVDFFGTDHARIGSELLRHWNLPDYLVDMVGGHHLDSPPGDPLALMRHTLEFADEVTHVLAPDLTEEVVFTRPLPETLLQTLQITTEQCEEVVEAAMKQVAVYHSL